jgi:hypothetical protein
MQSPRDRSDKRAEDQDENPYPVPVRRRMLDHHQR